MIAVAGHLLVDPSERDRYVAASRDLVIRARSATGCVDLFIAADSVDPRRVNNFELWSSQDDLDAFRAGAEPPETGIDIEGATMREYVIDHDREPFSTE